MSTITEIEKKLAELEAARMYAVKRHDLASTVLGVSDEGKDAQRDELHAARVTLGAHQQRAIDGMHPSPQALAEAADAVYALELSLMSDEERESQQWLWSREVEKISREYEAALHELGERKYANLGSQLAVAHLRVEEAQAQARRVLEEAREAERNERLAAIESLRPWPSLQTKAREQFSQPQPKTTPVAAMYGAFLAWLDAVEAASGKVPLVIGRNNAFFELQALNFEMVKAVAQTGRGHIDRRWRGQIEELYKAASAQGI